MDSIYEIRKSLASKLFQLDFDQALARLMLLSKEERLFLLKNMLSSRSYLERLAALHAISSDIQAEIMELVIVLTSDCRPIIRAAALCALKKCNYSLASELLNDALHDPDREVRQAAAELFHAKAA